jgi:hypothetical protein
MFTAEFKKIEDIGFPPDLVYNVDETGLYWKTLPSRTVERRKIGAWLQGIQGLTYSTPWREHIRNSKISFASHLDFKQKGLGHATNFLRMVF